MQRFVLSLLPILALMSWKSGYAVQEHDHGHDHSQQTQQALHLDNGSKWRTDESLRQGMQGIRALVEPHLQHDGHGTAEEFVKLAHGIQGNIDRIVQQCKLEPEADAVLHMLLADMFEGIAMLEGKKGEAARSQGVERVFHTLENYGRYFDHPGWERSHQH